MPPLDATARARLPDSSFAYIDSQGRRRLPINDASHVRNALARFEQTAFENDAARERARERLLRAAKKYGIVPLGFFDGQLRKARGRGVGALPRGTVTLLLTDIEGSTALLQRLGRHYTELLRDVRTIIRACVRRNDGREVDARADEFFAVFREPERALEAALGVQRSLRKRAWPGDASVRVRIGIHTGRPTLTDAGYVGIAVHTAARVCAASHGGHVLLSAASAEAIGTLDGIKLRALGRFTLPGLGDPLPLFLAIAPDLPGRFPGPRLTSAARHS